MNSRNTSFEPEKRLQLVKGAADIERLKLFYETAQPLARLLKELPAMRNPEVKLKVTLARGDISGPLPVEELFSRAGETQMVFEFPHLPEPLFERLCLRFRPFYMEKEDTKFLGITKLLKAQNPELRGSMDHYIRRWQKAVFWGRMGIDAPNTPAKVSAEDVIRAGFYSSYFHVTAEQRRVARAYEATLGKEMFRVALVSSVWERSYLVVELATSLRQVLIAQGWVTELELQGFERESDFGTQTTLTVEGGKGRATLIPIASGSRSSPQIDEQ